TAREQFLADIPESAKSWADTHLARLHREYKATAGDDLKQMIQLVVAVAARGDAVIVGRGAGFLLPPQSTVHARVGAPLEARDAYFAQWLRMTRAEAAVEVQERDDRRAKFLSRTLGCNPDDATGYDVIVNSQRLGIESAAQFIGWAVRTKQQFIELHEPEQP